MAAETVVNQASLYSGNFQFPLRPDDFVAVTGIGCYSASASMIGGLALVEWAFETNFNYDGVNASWGTGDPGLLLDVEDSAGVTVRDLADAAYAAMAGYAEQDFATYWLHRYYCQAGTPGEGGEAKFRWVLSTHVVEGGGGVWVYGPEAMDLSWSLSVSDLRLWRDITADPPPKRQHMHPIDAEASDYWVCGPDCQLVASIGGLTATAAYDALEEGVVVTPETMAGWALTFGGHVQGVMESGTSYFHMGMGGGGAPLDAPAIDEQAFDEDLETRVEEVDVVGGAGGWDLIPNENYSGYAIWFGTMNPPLIIGYDVAMLWFPGDDEEATLDPLVWDGFQDSSGTPEARLASSLPSSVAIAQVSWSTDVAFKADTKFAPTIDAQWARENLVCPSADGDVAGTTEAMNDLYLGVHASPANKWPIDDPWQEVGTVNAVEADVLPLIGGLGAISPIGDGVTIDGTDDAPTVTVPATGTGGLQLTLATPYFDRLALLQQLEVAKNWRWPFLLDADAEQDAVNWDAHAYLKIGLTRPVAQVMTVTLAVAYQEPQVFDPHYTSGVWRAAEFTWSTEAKSVVYTATLEADQTEVVFDLLCPDDGRLPWLHLVDSLTLDGLVGEPVTGDAVYTIDPIRLIADPGADHTGRDNDSTPRLVSKACETWDFLSDWQSVLLQRDGQLDCAKFAGEPWANAGPERGFGYIEAMQHSPDYTGPASLLHFARPLTELGLLAGKQGLGVTLGSGLTDMVQDSQGRSIGTPMLYWLANWAAIEPQSGGLQWSCQAAPQVTTWNLALGVPYVCRCRKLVGGAAHGLLRTADDLRRITAGDAAATGVEYAIFRQPHYYHGSEPIANPGGTLPVDGWDLVESGDLVDVLGPHGIVSFPGGPSDTAFEHPTEDPDDVDPWRVQFTYLALLWDGSGWLSHDLAEADGYADLLADENLLWLGTYTVATRRWTNIGPLSATGAPALDMTFTPWGKVALVRGGGLAWPDGGGEGGSGLALDQYSPHAADGRGPELSRTVLATRARASLAPAPDGRIWIVSSKAGNLKLALTDATGRRADEVATLLGHDDPDMASDPHTGSCWLTARQASDGHLTVHTLMRPDPASEPAFAQVGDLGAVDLGGGAVAVMPDGAVLVARAEGGTIHVHRSDDQGRTWSELT